MDKRKKFPEHIAIIMDGNGRWAKARGLKRFQGHTEGVKTVRTIVEECAHLGLKELTLYAFSTENWKRPSLEISFLMRLLKAYLKKERKTFRENNIRFRSIGNRGQLSQTVQDIIRETEEYTSDFTGMILRLAVSYGGRDELLWAMKEIARQVKRGELDPEDIDEASVQSCLFDPEMRDPDLIIRTSGEYRLSNFLLWQSSYSEIWICDTFWPDFSVELLHQAIEDYRSRERRFGAVPTKD